MMRLGPWTTAFLLAGLTLCWSLPAWSDTCPDVSASFQLDGETVPSNVSGAMFRNCESVIPDVLPEFGLYVDETDELVQISIEEHEASRSHRNDEVPDDGNQDDGNGANDQSDPGDNNDEIEGVRRGLYEITFEEQLADNTTYRFEAEPQCASHGLMDSVSWTFDTTTEAEVPEQIGTWEASNNVVGQVRWAHPETCTHVGQAAYVNLSFEPTPEAEVWGEAIAFETWVNEEIWEPQLGVGETPPAGAGRLGYGDEQVYAHCEPENPPESKPYAPNLQDSWMRVNMDAWLPGTEHEWEGENLTFLVTCPDEEVEEEEEEEEEEDDGEGDGYGAGGDEGDVDESACSQIGSETSGLALLLALVGLAVWRRRS